MNIIPSLKMAKGGTVLASATTSQPLCYLFQQHLSQEPSLLSLPKGSEAAPGGTGQWPLEGNKASVTYKLALLCP